MNQRMKGQLGNHLRRGACSASALALLAGLVAGCSADADSNEYTASEGATVLLDDRFSETGRLLVVVDDQGNLGMAVHGRIGVDDERIVQSSQAGATLADVYSKLHPEAPAVPESVRVLSDSMLEQQRERVAHVPASDPVPGSVPVLETRSLSTFRAGACIDIAGVQHGLNGKWDNDQNNFGDPNTGTGRCFYMTSVLGICSGPRLNEDDRSFYWNESPHNGKHSLSASTWKPAAPAWTFGWAQWGGVYTNANACINLNAGSSNSPLGITHHNWLLNIN